MRLSRFAHFFQRDGAKHFALFHAGKIRTVFIENEHLQTVESWKTQEADVNNPLACDLRAEGFLVNAEEDDEFLRKCPGYLLPQKK